LGRSETAKVRILEKILVVVPTHEPVAEDGEEREDGDGSDREWDHPPSRRACRQTTRLQRPGRRLQTTIVPQKVFCVLPCQNWAGVVDAPRYSSIPSMSFAGIWSSSMLLTRCPSSQRFGGQSRRGVDQGAGERAGLSPVGVRRSGD